MPSYGWGRRNRKSRSKVSSSTETRRSRVASTPELTAGLELLDARCHQSPSRAPLISKGNDHGSQEENDCEANTTVCVPSRLEGRGKGLPNDPAGSAFHATLLRTHPEPADSFLRASSKETSSAHSSSPSIYTVFGGAAYRDDGVTNIDGAANLAREHNRKYAERDDIQQLVASRASQHQGDKTKHRNLEVYNGRTIFPLSYALPANGTPKVTYRCGCGMCIWRQLRSSNEEPPHRCGQR